MFYSFLKKIFGRDSSLLKHLKTDWLVSCWFFLFAAVVSTVGSYMFLMFAENERQFYLYLCSLIDSLIFIIGGAYYVAGSYPNETGHRAVNIDDDTLDLQANPNNIIEFTESSIHLK